MAHHPMWPGRGAVAQLGERRLCKAEVGSSILPGSTTPDMRTPAGAGFVIGERQGRSPAAKPDSGPSQPKSDGTANGFGARPLGGGRRSRERSNACEP